MNWATKYALENMAEDSRVDAVYLSDGSVQITIEDQPPVLTVFHPGMEVTEEIAERYFRAYPKLDFLCGYKRACFWHGDAIVFLSEHNIGWGTMGTLTSAMQTGEANTASSKIYKFASDALQTMGGLKVERLADRIFQITGRKESLRVFLLFEYQPAVEHVRSIIENHPDTQLICLIDPNVRPTQSAINHAEVSGVQMFELGEAMSFIRRQC